MSLRVKIKVPKYNIPEKKVAPVMLPIDSLLPHEEIVTERLNDLVKYLKSIDAVDIPIIVAPTSLEGRYLIVDGHHRWAALKELGARKVPSIIIDYFDPSVKVYTWYPGVSDHGGVFMESLQNLDLRIVECPAQVNLIQRLVEGDVAFIILDAEGKCLKVGGDIEEQRKITSLLDKLNREGHILLIWYGLVEDGLADLGSGEINYLLLRRAVSKMEVMRTAEAGKVFPPKTTRHVLPYMPAKVYTPLETLY